MEELHVIQIGGTPKDLEEIKELVARIFGVEPISQEELDALEGDLVEWAALMREAVKMYGLAAPQNCTCDQHGVEHYMDENNIISVFIPVADAPGKGLLDKEKFSCVVKLADDKLELFRRVCHTVEELHTAIAKLSGGRVKKLD